jgi:tellurite resistance protein TehA-like permease
MTFPVSSASRGVVHALVLVSAWVLNAYRWLSAVPYWLLALFLGVILLGIIVAALKRRPARRV